MAWRGRGGRADYTGPLDSRSALPETTSQLLEVNAEHFRLPQQRPPAVRSRLWRECAILRPPAMPLQANDVLLVQGTFQALSELCAKAV
jgi:hypothetical protein